MLVIQQVGFTIGNGCAKILFLVFRTMLGIFDTEYILSNKLKYCTNTAAAAHI